MTNENIYYSLPKVAVIILNWNGKEDTLECLTSVKKLDYSNYEIVLVDNGSVDGSVDAVSKQYPQQKLLAWFSSGVCHWQSSVRPLAHL